MRTWIGIFALMVLCFGPKANAYTHKKAILLVDKDLQPDSLGYNFVSDLANDLYGWISSGQVVLWDSPEKKSVLSLADLKNVEAKSMASFTRLTNVFI
jgi:Leu/Phe-tRNA-protein transferase